MIADTENHVIRKYLPAEGLVVQVAGSGKRGGAGLAALRWRPNYRSRMECSSITAARSILSTA